MQDRPMQFQLTSVLAVISGCIGVALVALGFFVDRGAVGDAGLMFTSLAAVLRIRSWFCRMAARERNAYELGRDSVRSLR